MTTQEIKNKIQNGFEIKAALVPTKKRDKITFKIILTNGDTLSYLNFYHCKDFLSKEQMEFKNLFNEVKGYTLSDKMSFNIKIKKNPSDVNLLKIKEILNSIKNIKSISV